MFNVINIDGSLTCGDKICSSKKKKKESFLQSFKKIYIPRFVVLKLACTLAAFLKCQPDVVSHYRIVFSYFLQKRISLVAWIGDVLKQCSSKVFRLFLNKILKESMNLLPSHMF